MSLRGEDLRVYFEGVKAVDGVDIKLDQGEILGLIGPNGAGKTTLMNALSGFVPLESGAVTLGEGDGDRFGRPIGWRKADWRGPSRMSVCFAA